MRRYLHYRIHGDVANVDKKWLILIHGAGGSIATWNRQIEKLSEHFRLMLIDLRDHGLSKNLSPSYTRYNFDIVSTDILSVLEKEGISKAHFVTLSFGSVMMQALYERKPDLVDQIVFIGGIFNANWGIKGFVHLARFLNVFLSYSMMYRVFSFLLMPKKELQFARRVYQQQPRRLGSKEYLQWLGLYSEFFYLLKSFHQQPIDHPMLILMGEDDYLFLPSARTFSRTKENVQLELIAKAGHICNIDQPTATNTAILNFLLSQEPSAKTPATTALFEAS